MHADKAAVRSVPQAILEAAKALFAQQGFDAVSMSAIATRAGVSKGNLFHHFGCKEELHVAVLRQACVRSSASLERALAEGGEIKTRMDAFIQRHLAVLEEDPECSRLLLREIMQSSPGRGQELAERVFGDNFHNLTKLFRDGQQSGELAADMDPGLAAFVLLSANVVLFQARYVIRHLPDAGFAHDPMRYGCMLSDLLCNGILRREDGAVADGRYSANRQE